MTTRQFAGRVMVMAVIAIAACSNGGADKTTGPGPAKSVAGSYALKTIDAARPPAEVYHGPWFDSANKRFYNQMVMLVKSGAVELDGDGGWVMTLDAEITLDGAAPLQQQVQVNGQYTIAGDQITLQMAGSGGALPGTIQQRTISLSMDMGGNKRFKAYAFTK